MAKPAYIWNGTNWVALLGDSQRSDIDQTIINAKGDLIVGTAADTISRLPVGTDGTILVADSSATEGIKWFQQPLVHSSDKYYAGLVTSGSGFVTGLGTAYLTPFFVTKTTTYTKIAVRVLSGASAGRTARLGIYGTTNGLPDALILDAGTVDCSTTGSKSITINQTLTPAVYFLATVPQGSSAGQAFRSAGGGVANNPYVGTGLVSTGINANPISGYSSTTSITGALPNPFTNLTFSPNTVATFLGV